MSTISYEEKEVDIDVAHLARSLWSRKAAVLLTTAVFAAAAFAISSLIAPSYKSDTRILIESRESSYTRSQAAPAGGDERLSPESVESQVSLMLSSELLGTIADRFKLAGRPEFAPSPSFVDRVLTRVRAETDSPEGEVVARLREKLNVYRVEQTHVIVVEFSSHDPALARDVPNAIAGEYLSRQKGALLSSNASATGWLEQEIADLRKAVKAAETKVAAFRASSDLLVGQNQSVLATQQLSEIATELSRTRAAKAAAEGRAKSLSDALAKGKALDAMSEVLESPTIQALRERQAALRSQIADLSTTLLDGHPRIRSLRSQLRDIGSDIAREAAKVQSSLETEADSARQRETALLAEMEGLKKESARAGSQEVELRSLEREADAQSQLLESYLTRYREAVARGERDYLPVDARVFSEASLPAEPYFPKIVPITAAAALGGFLLASLVLLLKALFGGSALRPLAQPRPMLEATPTIEPLAPRPADRAMQAPEADAVSPPAAAVGQGVSAADIVEAILSAKIERIVVMSFEESGSVPGSVALARRLASRSSATVLVDLSPNEAAAASMGLAADAQGLSHLSSGRAALAEIIHRDRASNVHLVAARGFVPSEAGSDGGLALAELLDALDGAYSCVLVECGTATGRLAKLMGGDAALLVSAPAEAAAKARATVGRLADLGFADAILMTSGEAAAAVEAAA